MTQRIRRPCWIAFFLPACVALWFPHDWPRWAFMWTLAAAIYFACKILTWCAATTKHVPVWRRWAYLLLWPGMNAASFFAPRDSQSSPPGPREWATAGFNMLVGGLIFWNAQHFIPPSWPIVLGWAGMIGTILMLHFGSFHLLSCFWRQNGIDAPPLMNYPTHSTSIAEFWGRRWNMAFRDLTYQFLFRPLTQRWGPITALVIGFVISGIIHDVVISIPAGGGYGGPTCFFGIQALAILFERSRFGKRLGLGGGLRGWLFVAVVVLLPVGLLFHEPFITRIVLPFMEALGAA